MSEMDVRRHGRRHLPRDGISSTVPHRQWLSSSAGNPKLMGWWAWLMAPGSMSKGPTADHMGWDARWNTLEVMRNSIWRRIHCGSKSGPSWIRQLAVWCFSTLESIQTLIAGFAVVLMHVITLCVYCYVYNVYIQQQKNWMYIYLVEIRTFWDRYG